jgi:acetolactate synthase-1/2/3 large subunit
VFSALRGTDAFQESDVVGMTLGCTKWNIQIADAAEIPQAVRTAFKVATDGRPGPVLIDITKDAQFATLIDEDASKRAGIGQEGAGQVSAGQVSAGRIGAGCKEDHYEQWAYADEAMTLEGLDAAAKLINEAERPLMMVGQGVLIANASREARLFAERTGMPVASTLLGLSAIASDHPQYVGMLGMHGNYAPNMLTNKADVIVAVGMRFDDRVTGRLDAYAPNARIVHIEIDPAEVNKCVRAEVALIADARAALEALTPLTEHRSRDEWRAQFRALDAQEHEQVIHPDLFPADGPIKMGEVVNELSAQTDGRAIIVSDVGQHQMFAARYYQFREPDSHVSSGGLGTMGFALPAAIGAKMGNPEREVVAIIGDGGFQMTLQELGTIMQSGAAVKIIVLNNGYLGMVRQWQQLFFDRRYSHVEMASPNLVVLAAAYGIAAERCADRHALGSAIGNLLSSDGAALLEVCVGAEDNIFPMIAAGDAVDEIRLS